MKKEGTPPEEERKLAWLHLSFDIPSLWEVVAFSFEETAGRLEFSTREGHQARFAWLKSKDVPDLPRMLTEFHKRRLIGASRKEELETFRGLEFRTEGPFTVGIYKDAEPFQAALFHPELKTSTICSFPCYTPKLYRKTLAPLLRSFHLNTDPLRRWAVWGLDFSLPQDYVLTDVKALPADVTMSFESSRGARVTLRRWGLAPLLLRENPLHAFYKQFLLNQKAIHVERISDDNFRFRGHEAALFRFEMRGKLDMERLVGKWWQGTALVFLDREAMRITACDQWARAGKTEPMEFDDVFTEA